MGASWKPDTNLVTSLVDSGVDIDIINDLLNQINFKKPSDNPLVVAREFVRAAISQQVSWGQSFNEPEVEQTGHIQPRTVLKRGWRPKEQTIQMLTVQLEFDRVKIGFIREAFIQQSLGQTNRDWDCNFIRFVFSVVDVESQHQEGTVVFDKNDNFENEQSFTALEIATNFFTLDSLINELLKDKYISPYFNHPLNDRWQPARWVVRKLCNITIGGRKITKKYIYRDVILKPFISFQLKFGGIFDDYNSLYYHWVLQRFPKELNILERQKKKYEKLLRENQKDLPK